MLLRSGVLRHNACQRKEEKECVQAAAKTFPSRERAVRPPSVLVVIHQASSVPNLANRVKAILALPCENWHASHALRHGSRGPYTGTDRNPRHAAATLPGYGSIPFVFTPLRLAVRAVSSGSNPILALRKIARSRRNAAWSGILEGKQAFRRFAVFAQKYAVRVSEIPLIIAFQYGPNENKMSCHERKRAWRRVDGSNSRESWISPASPSESPPRLDDRFPATHNAPASWDA